MNKSLELFCKEWECERVIESSERAREIRWEKSSEREIVPLVRAIRRERKSDWRESKSDWRESKSDWREEERFRAVRAWVRVQESWSVQYACVFVRKTSILISFQNKTRLFIKIDIHLVAAFQSRSHHRNISNALKAIINSSMC
jgi:hypothetical protein